MKGFYYLHTNGSLIWKPESAVQGDLSYFDSPFVHWVWPIETDERLDAWRLLLESLVMGANPDRVKELASEWGCTVGDLPEYLVREGQLGPVSLKRRAGLKLLLDAWGLDATEVLDHISAAGDQPPDMARFHEAAT